MSHAVALQNLEFFQTDGQPVEGLVAAGGPSDSLPPYERVVVNEVAAFKKIDFVFFRRFTDQRSSHVAAFVVDNTDQRWSEGDLAELHRDLWLYGAAPLLYVAWPARVDVLSCARGPDFWSDEEQVEYQPAEAIRLAADIDQALRQRFSAWRLADGTFWDDPRNNILADDTKAAHRQLIQAIVETDRELEGESRPVRRRLLLLTVLIKYLEDRDVFPPRWFAHYHKGAKTFFDVLRDGSPDNVRRLLATLEKRFNGDVFCLPDDGMALTKTELRTFSDLVEGKTLDRQRHLWKLFSFEHIPVEVVSRLYQRFVHGGHGVVYTPPFLAALLLDHAMPYDKLTGRERVLDPACGSGIFLVGAFKRLVTRWRSQNGWQSPDVPTLRAILRDSIFGMELEPGAVDLAAFSLSLAVCDALKPNVIWNELKFDRLRDSNLREADFFAPPEPPVAAWPDKFDIVVGNPPFESKVTEPGAQIAKAMKKQVGELPDKQAAYLFLHEGIRRLSDGGRLCLIQPSGFLYNSGPLAFRRHIFGLARVTTVLDFTSVRNLYDGADPKTVAILAEAGQPDPVDWITHLTFRRTFSAYRQLGFEIDHYDHHRLPQRLAIEHPFVWRPNLLGGGRLVEMSERLRRMRTFAQFIGEQDGWDYGEGFIAAETGRREPAPWLTGLPLLPTEAIDENGIDKTQLGPDVTVTATHFRSAYTIERYSAPLLLIKEHETLPLAFWENGPLAYRHKIVGIHAPPERAIELRAIYDRLYSNRQLYRFCCALNGTQAFVGKSTVPLKQDIDVLPYPVDEAELDFSFWEQALQEDVLEHMGEFIRLGQNSPLLTKPATAGDLERYSMLFLRLLGSIYRNLRSHKPIMFDGLICQPFYFGDKPDLDWLGDDCKQPLRQLIHDESRESLRTIRIVRFYTENVILIVKPDRLRYWIPSTAIRDADETLLNLREQGW